MVPLVVAPVACHMSSKAVRTVHQFVTIESYVELVLCITTILQTAAIREQSTTPSSIGLEPEHQCVVLIDGAVQSILRHLKTIVALL